MITKNITKLPKSVTEIQITVPWADLEPKHNEVFNKLAAEVEIPGFRKGAAPANMVEGQIAGNVQQELIKQVMPQFLMEALQGTEIVPIDYPQYQLTSLVKGGELKFSAKVTERPKVTVGDYKGIKVTKPSPKIITETDVEKIITDLFNRWKARQPATGNSQPAVATNSQSGSMNFNPSANSGQVSQQPAVPETPNDDFAKAVGATSLTDLKTKIKTDLENEAKYESELDYEESILQEVEKMTTVEVPDVLIQDELNRMLVSLQRRVADMGLLLEDYLKNQNKTLEGVKSEWRPQAEKNVRMELGLSEVARAENVNITDEELQAEINKITDAKVKSQFEQQEPRMHLRHALRQTKTLNLLKTLVG